jgi:hypothetical protein
MAKATHPFIQAWVVFAPADALTKIRTVCIGFIFISKEAAPMAYRLELTPGKRIIFSWISRDFDLQDEFETYLKELRVVLDEMGGPTIFLSDLRDYSVDFGDVTKVLGVMTRGDLAVLNHPNLHKTIVVTEHALVKLGTQALGQNQYGSLRAQVVKTTEEGMEEAEKELVLIAAHE